jgi:trans-aconitate methyltransferase
MDFLQTLDLVDSIWDTQYTVQQSNNYPMIKWVKPLSEDPHYVHIVS